MQTRPVGRGLEIATAIALGVVTLVTALGVLQSAAWTSQATRLAEDSSDARDQSVTNGVLSQVSQRSDYGATLEAQRLTLLQNDAIAADDYSTALSLELSIQTALTAAYELPDGSFDAWRDAGFPADANPAQSADYLVIGQGEADALLLTSQRLGALSTQFTGRSAIFGQATLVYALALFLFGVAGINRLRVARVVTLVLGTVVFVFGLFLASTAY
ncbi:MAG: hypothetical protein ABIR17_11905 [Pseudolysinimonas sp.]|uniref:hypothetical protein n=1 Tax=Pseudolysinimonas sp. TaxID=2680009 RepID=UPI0032679CC5